MAVPPRSRSLEWAVPKPRAPYSPALIHDATTDSMHRTHAILLASGSGARFGSEQPKQFETLAGRTILEHAIAPFESHSGIDRIHLVVAAEFVRRAEELVELANLSKVQRIVPGGATRQESSSCGLQSLDADDLVLIHDVARPCLTPAVIDRCLAGLEEAVALTAAVPVTDTVLQSNPEGFIDTVPDRNHLMLTQTPQGFRVGLIRQAHEHYERDSTKPPVTDDCGLVVHYDLAAVKIVPGDPQNLKITHPEDMESAKRFLMG